MVEINGHIFAGTLNNAVNELKLNGFKHCYSYWMEQVSLLLLLRSMSSCLWLN